MGCVLARACGEAGVREQGYKEKGHAWNRFVLVYAAVT
jgi:hypothetical protein